MSTYTNSAASSPADLPRSGPFLPPERGDYSVTFHWLAPAAVLEAFHADDPVDLAARRHVEERA